MEKPTSLAPISLDLRHDLLQLIEDLREADGSTLLLDSTSPYSEEALLSSFEKSVLEGTAGYSELASRVRSVCKRAILDNFDKSRPLAQHADRLLDKVNNALRLAEGRVASCVRRQCYNQTLESGRVQRSIVSTPAGKTVNEFLQVTFNQAYLDVQTDGRDLRDLILKANPSLAVSSNKDEKVGRASGAGGCGSLKTHKRRSGGEGSGSKKRNRTQSEAREMPFDDVFQKLLAGALVRALGDNTRAENIHKALKDMPRELLEMSATCGNELSRKQVTEVIRENGMEISRVCDDLCNASFESLECAMVQCSLALMEQWETFRQSESMKRLKTSPTHGVRLSKIKSACDNFVEAVHTCAEEFLDSYEKYVDKKGSIASRGQQKSNHIHKPFPSCIEKNMEAYFQGVWRKQPYKHRAYTRLSKFEVGEQSDSILKRVMTKSPDGCSREFRANHEKYLKESLNDVERALVQAVSNRKILELGKDILEAHTWGMDCYTRRNVHDALLEFEFGEDLSKVDESKLQSFEQKISTWVECILIPSINKQDERGWDMQVALNSIISEKSLFDASAATAIKDRLALVGYNYFRLHPKGQGVLCINPDGIQPFTFVEEYFGILHTPWRWFEIQDTLKKYIGEDLPDFYNIVLERPRQDPAGYDVMFVDAASKGSVASRMSHSCNPNCQAVVLSCKGRLTIAVYTTRKVEPGEELTFDYSSVTESEKEYRAAVCLCGTSSCRGSFLFFTGSSSFMEVMNKHHTFLQRNAMLLRACDETLTEADRDRIKAHGLGDAALGTINVDRIPGWLEKWVSLCLGYVEKERSLLPSELVRLSESSANYTSEQAEAQAKGVSENRLQNIVITLDKIKLALGQPCQPEVPPLAIVPDKEVIEYLWNGEKSIAKRAVRASLVAVFPNSCLDLKRDASLRKGPLANGYSHPFATQLYDLSQENALCLRTCQEKLLTLESILRSQDRHLGSGVHTACADILHLHARTKVHFAPEKSYRGFKSEPLEISLQSLSGVDLKGCPSIQNECSGATEHRTSSKATQGGDAPRHADNILLSKNYSSRFIWGQLVVWFKQTVTDPTTLLSDDRRGPLSLPDIESCYGGCEFEYINKERDQLLEQIEQRPDCMWNSCSMFCFDDEPQMYGTPMLDSVLHGDQKVGKTKLKELVEELRVWSSKKASNKKSSATRKR